VRRVLRVLVLGVPGVLSVLTDVAGASPAEFDLARWFVRFGSVSSIVFGICCTQSVKRHSPSAMR